MVDGWKPVVVGEELHDAAREYYEANEVELKLKEGVRSLTGFINYTIREYLKEKGII